MTPEQFPCPCPRSWGFNGQWRRGINRGQKAIITGKALIAGIHSPLDVEKQFISERGIATLSPSELRQNPQAIDEWIARERIEYGHPSRS